MPRLVRIEFEGAYYHVMRRGYRRGAIFQDAIQDRGAFWRLGAQSPLTGL